MAILDTVVIHGNDQFHEPLLDNNGINHGDQEDSNNQILEGVVNYKGEKVRIKSNFGGWRSAAFIIADEIGETIAYYGISSNLISYLTGPLGQSTAVAATNINIWGGMVWMLPLLGAFVADSYLGRFRTILLFSIIYFLGLGFLTLSVVIPTFSSPPEWPNNTDNRTTVSISPLFREIFFFFSLYLVAFGRAGYKPCAEAFGADQFDARIPEERSSKSSFFNWWYFGLCIGSSTSQVILIYIQDNLSWGLGFGIPCISMLIGLIVFLLGMKTYRFSVKEDEADNPLLRIARVFSAAAKNWRTTSVSTTIQDEAILMSNGCIRVGADQFKFLDKALIGISDDDLVDSRKHSRQCSIDQVEDAKAILRLIPIWTTCLMYAVVWSQSLTFFIKQGKTMDRTIIPSIQIPAASLSTLIPLSVMLLIPIYDLVVLPLFRLIVGKPNGISMLQRIGFGLLISTMSMVVAAIIESKRLKISLDAGLIDKPEETVPLSVWWLVPQYLMFGLAEVFTVVGLQEFFYDQVPDELRSMGISFFFSIFGIGQFLCGFLISAIDNVTGGSGQYSWFTNNLNRAHLDYFYWLLAGLGTINIVAYLYFSKSYLYKRSSM